MNLLIAFSLISSFLLGVIVGIIFMTIIFFKIERRNEENDEAWR